MNLDRIIAVRTNKTVYRDGEYCVKVFDDDFSKVDVLNEALNQARVEETGLNVPKIVEVTKIDGKWAIVSEYVRAKRLQDLWKKTPTKKTNISKNSSIGKSRFNPKSAPCSPNFATR